MNRCKRKTGFWTARLLVVSAISLAWLVWDPDSAYAQYSKSAVTVQFEVATYNYAESAGKALITVTLSAAVDDKEVTVKYRTVDNKATSPKDYQSSTGTLTFAPGETQQSFDVVLVDNSLADGHRSLGLELYDPVNVDSGSPNPATLQILDDDLPPPTVQFGSATYWVGENSLYASITVTLSYASTSLVSVEYTTLDGLPPNEAVAPYDYLTAQGILDFYPGETSKTFDIEIVPDDLDQEGEETVRLKLSNPINAAPGLLEASLIIQDGKKPMKPLAGKIDPVSHTLEIGPNAVENIIKNPVAIISLKDADATEKTAARIEATEVTPDNPKPEDLEWKIINTDVEGVDEGGAPRAKFLAGKKNGRGAYVYGAEGAAGRVRFELWTTGAGAQKLDYLEAVVFPMREIKFRVNLLKTAGGFGTNGTVPLAEDHIRIANIYLRQLALKLVPDPDQTADANVVKVKDGFFTGTVPLAHVTPAEPVTLWGQDAVGVNSRPKIVQITYIAQIGKKEIKGAAITFPGNELTAKKFEEKPKDTGMIKYRITVDSPSENKTMAVFGRQLFWFATQKEEDKWGMVLTNKHGPHALAQRYGATIAHELGHMMSLGHRKNVADGLHDLLDEPGDKNIMFWDTVLVQLPFMRVALKRGDFDLIQAYVVTVSHLVKQQKQP